MTSRARTSGSMFVCDVAVVPSGACLGDSGGVAVSFVATRSGEFCVGTSVPVFSVGTSVALFSAGLLLVSGGASSGVPVSLLNRLASAPPTAPKPPPRPALIAISNA